MANTPINPDCLFKMPGFHQIVTSNGNKTIHIAGQGPFDADMKLIGGDDYKAQAIQAFGNLAAALAAAGATPDDVVSSVMYVKNLTSDATTQFVTGMNEALDGKPFPANASSLIGVHALGHPDMLVEISAVAVVDS